MNRPPLWSAIIPTYGKKGVALTRDCLRSMMHSTERHEIIVVDDGSPAEAQVELDNLCREFGADFIPRGQNAGFAKTCNAGIGLASGEVVVLVNNDTQQIGKTLDDLANFARFVGAATVGCKLLYANQAVQHAGVCYVPSEDGLGYFDHIGRGEPRWRDFVCRIRRSLCTGGMLAINRFALDSVGLLDERYGMAFEDLDYQLRCIETGFNVFYCGIIESYHYEGRTRGSTPQEKARNKAWTEAESRARELFFDRWYGVDFGQFMIGAEMR